MKPPKKINNFVAKHSQSSGAGAHGKTKKAIRKSDKDQLSEKLKSVDITQEPNE